MGNHHQVAAEVHKILHRNRCGLRFRARNAPDGEEAHNLFWVREHIAPLPAYVQEEPPDGHATVQNARNYPASGYDQQRLTSASYRIPTFAGHRISTMIVRIRQRCPPSRDTIPPLGRVVTHGPIENAPHLGSHAAAQQPPEPQLVRTKDNPLPAPSCRTRKTFLQSIINCSPYVHKRR